MSSDLEIGALHTEAGEKRRRGVRVSNESTTLKLDTFECDFYVSILDEFEKIDTGGEFWVRGLRSGALLFRQKDEDQITVKGTA